MIHMARISTEEIIKRAIREGKFDDLPGKGQPLQIDQYPYADPDWRIAHHILKSADFSLPWIERLRDIHTSLQQARESLERTWKRQPSLNDDQSPGEISAGDWPSAFELFREQVSAINTQIRSYNLEVPHPSFQISLVDVEQELARLRSKTD
jgi:DnaJ family protein C protein 28